MKIYWLLCVLLSLPLLAADDDAVLKQRVQARAAQVDMLREKGLAREEADGKLSATPSVDGRQALVIEEENKDRQAIFQIIAKKTKLTAADVAKKFGDRARKLNPVQTPSPSPSPSPSVSELPCDLNPVSGVDVTRLLVYLKQGMNYAAQKRPDLALQEFGQVIKIDPNFLGAEMNIGSARLMQKRYPEAEESFNKELKLIACFRQMKAGDLAKFAYMQEVGTQPPGQADKAQEVTFSHYLERAEADVHYNLACLRSRQNQKAPALAELRKAVAGGLIDRKSLRTDPDLMSIRGTSEFQALLGGVHGGRSNNQ